MDEPIDKIRMLGKKNRVDDDKKNETTPEKVLLKVFRARGKMGDSAHFDRFEVTSTAVDNTCLTHFFMQRAIRIVALG